MEEDNTPARSRKITGKMRLRLETAKKLREIRQNATKRNERQQKETNKGEKREQEIVGQIRGAKFGKNKLQEPPTPQAMFRKRQIYKTWLPTHLYHAKRAHMTAPKEPLWRFALPVTPTNKSYRLMHRASGQRGAVAWDTSYTSTIGLEGPEKSLQGLLKAIGVGANDDKEGVWAKQGERWRRGTRSRNFWLFERNGWPKASIGPATIVWCVNQGRFEDVVMEGTEPFPKTKKPKRKLFIRIHPAAFLQLWKEVLRLAKVQKPMVMVEDLRFEIGSIEVTGPTSTEALLGTLWPSERLDNASNDDNLPGKVWSSVGSLTNAASTPAGALLAFDIQDPRLHFPAQKADPPAYNSTTQFETLSLLSTWPPDHTHPMPAIFDRTARLKAQREMPSQKAINRRKSLATPGTYPESKTSDPNIPIMLLANRTPLRSQGSWTLLLPWKCVKPIWYCLMYVPLSTGGSVRFGGQREIQQVAFEGNEPWFPGDFPGTRAGREWEERERKKKKEEWERKPKGKRLEWESVNLGNGRKGEIGIGWGCDWERLNSGPKEAEQMHDQEKEDKEKPESKECSTESGTKIEDEKRKDALKQPVLFQLRSSIAHTVLNSGSPDPDFMKDALINIRLSCLARGVITPCSRIYRLPSNNPILRQEWLSLLPDSKMSKMKSKTRGKAPPSLPKNASQGEVQKRLARILFEPMNMHPGSKEYPIVPDEVDLIGFVTSGSYNLGEGQSIGIGSLLLSKVMERQQSTSSGEDAGQRGEEKVETKKGVGKAREDRICIVREAGLGFGRLAMWELC